MYSTYIDKIQYDRISFNLAKKLFGLIDIYYYVLPNLLIKYEDKGGIYYAEWKNIPLLVNTTQFSILMSNLIEKSGQIPTDSKQINRKKTMDEQFIRIMKDLYNSIKQGESMTIRLVRDQEGMQIYHHIDDIHKEFKYINGTKTVY